MFEVMIVLQFSCRQASLWSDHVFSHVYPYSLFRINRRGNYYFHDKSTIGLDIGCIIGRAILDSGFGYVSKLF